jgi:hypothetical protein
VTNEIQSILTEVKGVDKTQEISMACDDVTVEVQMFVPTAVNTNEEQTLLLILDDLN